MIAGIIVIPMNVDPLAVLCITVEMKSDGTITLIQCILAGPVYTAIPLFDPGVHWYTTGWPGK